MKKNIKIYYVYSAFSSLLILGPILTIFFLSKGLNFSQITLLQSFSAIGIVLFEVPTGAVADLLGRKKSLLMGSVIMSISLMFYALGNSFLYFAIAEILFALGFTLKSGADTSLLYDSLKFSGREEDFKNLMGKYNFISILMQVPGSIMAGYLYEININLPFIISAIFMIITFVIITFFEEPEDREIKNKNQRTYFEQIKDSALYIKNHEKIKGIMVFTVVFYIFFRAGFWMFQPYMKASGVPVVAFGWIFALFNLVAAFSSAKSAWIMDKTKPKTLIFIAGLIIVSFLGMGFVKVWIGTAFILLQQMARGIYKPTVNKYLNKHIESDMRATILSFHSLMINICVGITLPLIGMMMDRIDIYSMHLILGIVMIISIYLANIYLNLKQEKHKIKNI